MSAAPQPQTAIYETTLDKPELEKALEQREKVKADAGEARKRFKDADERAKGIIATLDLGDAPVRVGNFVITERSVAGRSVAFETGPTSRITISLLDEEA